MVGPFKQISKFAKNFGDLRPKFLKDIKFLNLDIKQEEKPLYTNYLSLPTGSKVEERAGEGRIHGACFSTKTFLPIIDQKQPNTAQSNKRKLPTWMNSTFNEENIESKKSKKQEKELSHPKNKKITLDSSDDEENSFSNSQHQFPESIDTDSEDSFF